MKREDVKEKDIYDMLNNSNVIFEKEFTDETEKFSVKICDYNGLIVLIYHMNFDTARDDIGYITQKIQNVNNVIYHEKDHFSTGIAAGYRINNNDDGYNTFFMVYFDKDDAKTKGGQFVAEINDIFLRELNNILESHEKHIKFKTKYTKFTKQLNRIKYNRPKEDYKMIVGNIKINQALQTEPVSTLNQDHRSIVNRHLFYFRKKENIILMN